MISKYVHINACLTTGYTLKAWREVKMMFIPAPGKVNCTQAKAYFGIKFTVLHAENDAKIGDQKYQE
jgi:hypothetical protein